MQTTNILAVATSISKGLGFDTLDALAYVIDNGFEGLQVFIDQSIITDAGLRGQIRAICEDHHLTLIAHAPATLNRANVSADPVHSAIADLLASESKALVVHHFDETVDLDETLRCLRDLHRLGFTPCLENFFMRGRETSENSFRKYLNVIRKARDGGIEVMPVFDIARLYDSKVKLADTAHVLIKEALNDFEATKTPIILHLIDTHSDAQLRSSWCPIGQGIIPYPSLFEQLQRRKIPIYMAVLEFEDKINPLDSKQFLEAHLPGRVIP